MQTIGAMLNFPKDHYTHDDSIEWWYWWGKHKDTFFHFATFRAGKGSIQARTSHWSLHNGKSEYWEEISDDFGRLNNTAGYMANTNRFTLNCPKFGITMTPEVAPIIHEWQRNYYSIPNLKGEGFMYPVDKDVKFECNLWMDHEFGRYRSLSAWDWVAIKLDCGMNIMATQAKNQKLSMIELKGNTIQSDFILDDRHLYFYNNTMHFTMKPLVEEKIFYPAFGMPYSEVPFEVIGKGEPIGYGIRERAYPNKEN